MARKKTIDAEATNEALPETVPEQPTSEAVPAPDTAQRRPPTHSTDDILALNDQERGIKLEDSEDVKWNYLAGALHRHAVLPGTVSGTIDLESPSPVCVVDYEGIRILIPGHEMFMDDWPAGEPTPEIYRIRLSRMLGSTVEFVPAGVDMRERAAVASRREALKQRQARYYASGRVKEGILITCRVIGVGNNRVTVEALGVDSIIPSSDLSWQWFSDVLDLYAPGDLIVARVMALSQREDGSYAVRLSVKAASENPDLPALRKLVPGNNYFGIVTGVRDRAIFLRLQAGANAKTMSYRTREMPCKNDTVCFHVRSVNEEYGMAFGTVTRIIKRGGRIR